MHDTKNGESTRPPAGDKCQTATLSVSEMCGLLANDGRRAVLQYLVVRPNQTVRVRDLADHLVAEGVDDERQQSVLSLQHLHLPKLANTGVIAYERGKQRLTYRDAPGLEYLLNFLEETY